MFKRLKSLQKAWRIQNPASIYDWAFFLIYLTTYYFRNKSSIIDVWLGNILASKYIEIFKVKLRWSKTSQLLQGVAFLVKF